MMLCPRIAGGTPRLLTAAVLCLCAWAFAGEPDALSARAQAHFDMKEYDQALALWRQALALQPQSIDLHIRIGTALTRLLQYREAEAAFREILALEPHNAMAYYHLGALFLHEQRHGSARENLLLALRHTPWYPDAHYLLGYMLEKEGRYPEAAKEYVAELQVNPASPNAWYHLMDLQKQGKFGRNWVRKVEWTVGKVVGLSAAMAVGAGLFVWSQMKANARSRHASAEEARE